MLRGRRADVQGLRGVAVLLVVLYHLDIGFDGGYLGVDVFFVISGFVIGALLHREADATGTIDVLRFYGRRIRRLWPTLALLTVVVLAVGALVLNPYDNQPFAIRTATAAHLLVANLYLYRHVGYFDESAALNPFLHTWSLSIEEQICLAVPLLFAFAARRRWTGALLATATVVSFALWWAMTTGAGTGLVAVPERFAFFSAPTRLWQFGLGALLAVYWGRIAALPVLVHRGAGALCVGAITAALTFASSAAVAPTLAVVAAGAAIVAGATPTGLARTLSTAPIGRVGDVSYAWYLWHWPALVFAQVLAPDALGARALALLASGAVAVASTRWWEGPLREGRSPFGSRRGAAAEVRAPSTGRLAVASVAVPLVVAGGAWVGAEWGWGVEVPIAWWDLPDGRQSGCNLFNRDVESDWAGDVCRKDVDDQRGTVLVLGDQHADGVAAGVADAAERLRLGTAVWSRTDCPLSTRAPADYPRCDEWQDAALRLVDHERPAAVVVANQSSRYVDPAGPAPITDVDGSSAERRSAAVEIWRAGTDELLAELDRLGVPVVVVGPAPDHGAAFARSGVSVIRPRIPAPTISAAAARHQRRGAFAADRDVAARHRRVAVVDPLPALCPAGRCPTSIGDEWWYYEARYLTATGGRRLAPDLERALRAIDAAPGG